MKVISGGQTGVDQAGLIAAWNNGLQTGGCAPKGYKTTTGSNYLLKCLCLKESGSDNYSGRTFENVMNSDATLRLAVTFESSGEYCTLKAIQKYKKPHLDVKLMLSEKRCYRLDPEYPDNINVISDITEWLEKNEIKVLNVAGNSEVTAPGIQVYAEEILTSVFKHFKEF